MKDIPTTQDQMQCQPLNQIKIASIWSQITRLNGECKKLKMQVTDT